MRDRRSDRFLPAWAIQVTGIVFLAVILILWRTTHDVPTGVLAIVGAMILLGGGVERTVYEAKRVIGRRGEAEPETGDEP